MKPSPIEIVLARILDALEADIIAASDDDIAAAVADLGMKPHMKGSVALFDLMYDRAGARFGDVANYEETPEEQRGRPLPEASQSANEETPSGAKGPPHRNH